MVRLRVGFFRESIHHKFVAVVKSIFQARSVPYEQLAKASKAPNREYRMSSARAINGGEPEHLSSILKLPKFSAQSFGALLKDNKIYIDHLNSRLKSELTYLCSINKSFLRSRAGFCDELVRWTDRHIRTIPAGERSNSEDAAVLVSLQKFAVNQLFMPDSGKSPARDRWQLVRDYFNVSETSFGAPPTTRMDLIDPEHTYAYATEFRYAGHMAALQWMSASGGHESLGEYVKLRYELDKETYHHHSPDRSFIPTIKHGAICDASGNKIAQERYIWVVRPDGTFILAFPSHVIGAFQHSYLNGGRRVVCAGEVAIKDGRIIAINRRSGHYKPDAPHLNAAIDMLRSQGFIVGPFINMGYAEISPAIYGRYTAQATLGTGLPVPPPAVTYRTVANRRSPSWQERADKLMHAFRLTSVIDEAAPGVS